MTFNLLLNNLSRENFRAIALLLLVMKYSSCVSETVIFRKEKAADIVCFYYVRTEKSVILLTIYVKSEQVDIAVDDVRSIIADYESSIPEEND